ncbi:MAG: hypothetical protein EBQ75_08510 [Actinobacteria bacterium]|nr:hypothetical protein [Actinomycetota bacterium]
MAINSVWVFAQVQGGAPTTGTLELLTKARSLSSNVAAFVGGDASAVAGALGEYGATKVYATGDLAGKLPGPAVSAAMKAVIDGGDSPSVIMFPQNYEGRDVMSRLSVKLDKTVLTNNVDIADSADGVVATTPIFGGNLLVTTAFTGSGPHLVSFRPKSFAAESASGGAAQVVAHPCQTLAQRVRQRFSRYTSRRALVRSSTKQRSSSLVVVVSAKPASTRWSRISPRC